MDQAHAFASGRGYAKGSNWAPERPQSAQAANASNSMSAEQAGALRAGAWRGGTGDGGLLADASRAQKVTAPTKSNSATYNDLAVQNYNDAKLLYNLSTGLQKTNPEFAKTYRSMADGYMAAGDNARNSAKGFYVYREPMWKNAPTQTTSFAPSWNTGEYSAGTPYAGGINKPAYVSVQLGFYVAAGGVSINLHNGDIYGQWSMNRAYPGYPVAPGASIVAGKLWEAKGPLIRMSF